MSPRSGAGGCPAGSCFTSRALQVTTNHRLPRYHVHLSSDRDLDNIHSTLFVFLNVFMSAGRPQAAFLGIVMPLPRSDPVTGNTVVVTTRVLEWVWGFLGAPSPHIPHSAASVQCVSNNVCCGAGAAVPNTRHTAQLVSDTGPGQTCVCCSGLWL